jgi:NADPH:quinone reductase
MKAISVREFGGPEVLTLEELPTPKPVAGQVLVRIRAAGVNPYDTYMRAGAYARKPALPYTPGSDGAGVVEAVGEGVNKVKQGDRIFTTHTLSGAYAEYALASEQQVHTFRQTSASAKAQEFGFPMERRIMRCTTRRKRMLRKPFSCTAQAAGLGPQPYKSPAPSAA